MSGRRLHVASVIMLLLLGAARAAYADPHRIVILYDERTDLPGMAALDTSLVRTLTEGSSKPLEIYRETLDLSRFGESYLPRLRDFLRLKYANKEIDVVVAAMGPSLDFVLAYRDLIFPGAAVVFCGLDRREVGRVALPSYVTGVLVKREFRPTLELALHFHPKTERVVVVGGTTEFDARLLQQARLEFRSLEKHLRFTYMSHLPMSVLLERLATLPPRTVVLYTTLFRDGAGEVFVPHDAAALIAKASNAPVYAFIDQYMGRGIVGGRVYSVDAHGSEAGKLALSILAGRPPSTLPFVETGASVNMFDWRQLRRWRIDTERLPTGSQIRYRVLTPWDQYRWYIVGAIAVAIVQAAIIVLLVIERARRRQIEKRYLLAAVAGNVSVWDWNLATDEVYVGPRLKALLGYTNQEIGDKRDDWARLIHADDAPGFQARANAVAEGRSTSFEAEHRMLHRDGTIHWFLTRGSVVHKHGRAVRITGTATDITGRKESEQALEDIRSELTRVSSLTALGEFSASIAHELRQPLTTILLNAQTCLRWLQKPAPDLNEINAALHDVVQGSQRAAQLIQRNSDLFKLHTVRKEEVDINQLIRDVVMIAKPRLQGSHVTVVSALSPKVPSIIGDRIELQQVLLNLIANAIDATQQQPPGQRRIEIRTSVTLGMNVQVWVKDNGVGLGDVDMKQLFKLSYTTKATGTGIGLSLCRSIIEAHGGRMWAEPNAGRGASFFFRIPVRTPSLEPVDAPPSAEPAAALV